MVSTSKTMHIAGLVKRLASSCMPFQTKISEKAFNLMADCEVCDRCMFRMVGIRERSIHDSIEVLPTVPSKRTIDESESTCSVCVGLLQMDYSSIASSAMTLLKEYNLKEKTFCLSMQLPPQLSIRNASIRQFLEEKLSQDDTVQGKLPEAVEIREIFRHLVATSFSKVSGFKFDNNVSHF